MSEDKPFLSDVEPWQLVADGYVEVTQAELAPYSADAIELVAPAADAHVLDVACGPGTLALQVAPRVARVTAIDFAARMVEHLQGALDSGGVANVEAHLMDGQDLSFDDASFDAAFSMFGLMFFPDRGKGLAELHRVVKPGGRVAIATWCPIDESPAIAVLMKALRAAVPELPEADSIAGLNSAEQLNAELSAAGFSGIDVHTIGHDMRYESAAEAWQLMEKGAAPVVMLARQMGDEWAKRSAAAIAHLEQSQTWPAALSQTALIGVATR